MQFCGGAGTNKCMFALDPARNEFRIMSEFIPAPGATRIRTDASKLGLTRISLPLGGLASSVPDEARAERSNIRIVPGCIRSGVHLCFVMPLGDY